VSVASIPCDRPRTTDITEASAETVELQLGVSDTAKLVQSNDTYQTNTQDLLLTALAQALTSWCNSDLIKIEMDMIEIEQGLALLLDVLSGRLCKPPEVMALDMMLGEINGC